MGKSENGSDLALVVSTKEKQELAVNKGTRDYETEQEKIGLFFNQLNGTNTLHQLKLDKFKKSFLQKMFI